MNNSSNAIEHVNPISHPVYERLPVRTQRKLLSRVSEDKLTWDCFFGLQKSAILVPVLRDVLGPIAAELPYDTQPKLIMWGFEITATEAWEWPPLTGVLNAVEAYGDGKPQGQLTEPDAIVVTDTSLVVVECKRGSTLGTCSRFDDKRCPEIHVDRRKRSYCQYWARGLKPLVRFPKPEPGTIAPECDKHYQLMRNYIIGTRLADALGLTFCPVVIKGRKSKYMSQTVSAIEEFNGQTVSPPKYKLACWTAFRDAAHRLGVEALECYAAELDGEGDDA